MRRIVIAVGCGLLGALLPLGCNVFATFSQCATSADCPSPFVCDPVGRFCHDQRPGNPESSAPDVTVAPPDAPIDQEIGSGPCDSNAAYGAPKLVAGLEGFGIFSARFTPDETTVVISALNGCSQEPCTDLLIASRPNLTTQFTFDGPLGGVNTTAAAEYWPTLSADGLLLFFESSRSLSPVDGGYINEHSRIWSSTRVNTVSEFGEPHIQNTFAVGGVEGTPYLHPGGHSLYFVSLARPGKGALDVFVAQLGQSGLASQVTNLAVVNTDRNELAPVVTLDERALYFARDTPIIRDIYVSRRPDPSSEFTEAVPVPELNSPQDDIPSWVSDDQCRIYLVSNRPVSVGADAARLDFHLWVAERPTTRAR